MRLLPGIPGLLTLLIMVMTAGAAHGREIRATRHVYAKDVPDAQVLDAHLLVGGESSPVLVSIVSGGWRSDPPKETTPGAFDPYHEMGYSAVAVCHRTVDDDVSWPAPADDVSRAIQFIRLHANEWNIDPNRITITGRSSGGHVAMMVGFGEDRADPDSDDPVSRQSSAVRCVIEQGGPADLAVHLREMLAADHIPPQRKEYLEGRLMSLLGIKEGDVSPEEMKQRLHEISPLRVIDVDTVPLLMLYTGPEGVMSVNDPRLQWDTHTPISGFLLAEKLAAAGVPHELVIAPELGRGSAKSLSAQREFLEKYNGSR